MERQIFFRWVGIGFIAVAIFSVICTLLIRVSEAFPKSHGDLATWVGAIASASAFLAAVWVPFRINESALRRERDRIKRDRELLIRSLWCEIDTLSRGFKERAGRNIERRDGDPESDNIATPQAALFTVYDGSVSRLGEIDDEALMSTFIATYAGFKALLSATALYEDRRKELIFEQSKIGATVYGPQDNLLKRLAKDKNVIRQDIRNRYEECKRSLALLEHRVDRALRANAVDK